jgi:hypothetical protein
MFAGDATQFPVARPVNDLGHITDTGIGEQGYIRCIFLAHNFTLVIVKRHGRFDVVAGQPDATIPDPVINHHSARTRDNPRNTIMSHTVGRSTSNGVGDLTRDRQHNEIAAILSRYPDLSHYDPILRHLIILSIY